MSQVLEGQEFAALKASILARLSLKSAYKFSSTQLNLNGDAALGILKAASRLKDSDLGEDGREDNPHITIFYGLHDSEPDNLEKVLADFGPITIKFARVSLFSGEEKDKPYDVVKVDIVSDDLQRLHKSIGDNLEVTETSPDYHPHATLGYVKAGLGKTYLSLQTGLEGESFTFDKISFSNDEGIQIELPLGEAVKGGPGSGNFGHSGRPGKIGGSGASTGSATATAGPIKFREGVSPKEYLAAQKGMKRSAYLTPYTEAELVGKRLFLSEDGHTGYMLSDGDFGNLFNNTSAGGIQGAGKTAIIDAIQRGAVTLDAFDTYLPELYARYGFTVTGRMKFNDKYAPEGWDFEKDGRPDVVFMAYNGGPRDTIAERVGTFKPYRRDEGRYYADSEYDLAKSDSRRTASSGHPSGKSWGAVRSKPLESHREQHGLLRQHLLKTFNENQPRVPAGGPDGGQFASVSGTGTALSSQPPKGHPDANLHTQVVANAYAAAHGLPPIDHHTYRPVSESRGKEIAAAYEALPINDSQNPEVKEAFATFAKEVEDQYDFAVAHGMTFTPWTEEGQPYANSSEMAADVRDNKHLFFFTGGNTPEFFAALDPDHKFRAVHDYFGHTGGGFGFGPRGEENAWAVHIQMFSEKARPAMTTLTRGQNSWVNFGRHNYDAEGRNKNIPPPNRPYAPQKMALLPRSMLKGGSLKNCGTGAGGFQPGNSCAGGGGRPPLSDAESAEGRPGSDAAAASKAAETSKTKGAHDAAHQANVNASKANLALADGLEKQASTGDVSAAEREKLYEEAEKARAAAGEQALMAIYHHEQARSAGDDATPPPHAKLFEKIADRGTEEEHKTLGEEQGWAYQGTSAEGSHVQSDFTSGPDLISLITVANRGHSAVVNGKRMAGYTSSLRYAAEYAARWTKSKVDTAPLGKSLKALAYRENNPAVIAQSADGGLFFIDLDLKSIKLVNNATAQVLMAEGHWSAEVPADLKSSIAGEPFEFEEVQGAPPPDITPDITPTKSVTPFERLRASIVDRVTLKGGSGSGNFGHEGRPGLVGGSGGGGGSQTPGVPRWIDPGGFQHTGIVWKQPVDTNGRPIPIPCETVEEAAALVLDGKVVEVADASTAHSLITRLSEMALDAKAAGKEAKDYDLCQVSVKGSNMFCAESLRSKEYPDGVPRIEMPQLGGIPAPGSAADKLPRNKWDPTEVDGAQRFKEHLENIGMKYTNEVVTAAGLKASQAELVGLKVSKMMLDKDFDPAKNPIFISRDNYVVDGHHRWAAVVGRDAEDGHLGDSTMNVVRVNAPISEVLHLANAWSAAFGIKQRAGVRKQAAATGLMKAA